jgi:hypothetical protein
VIESDVQRRETPIVPVCLTLTHAQVRGVFAEVRDSSFVDVDASGSVEEVHQRVSVGVAGGAVASAATGFHERAGREGG